MFIQFWKFTVVYYLISKNSDQHFNYSFVQDTLSNTQTPSKLCSHLQSKKNNNFVQVFQSRICWVGHFCLPLEDYNLDLVEKKKIMIPE